MKKKVIVVKNNESEFEKQLNSLEGKFTQTSMCCNGTDVFFMAVLFYEEDNK
jgi:hypothetical protein